MKEPKLAKAYVAMRRADAEDDEALAALNKGYERYEQGIVGLRAVQMHLEHAANSSARLERAKQAYWKELNKAHKRLAEQGD